MAGAVQGGVEHAEAAQEAVHHALFNLFGLDVTSRVTTMWGIMLILLIISLLATRGLQAIPRGRKLQVAMEMLLDGLLGFFGQIMGMKKARRYFPVLMTLFLFIIVSNYSGLLPGMEKIPGMEAPTNTWSVTLGLAAVVFFCTHFFGVQHSGLAYFKHFFQPLPFMFPLNVIEEFVKPLSLSLRLYGNIFGEEMIIAALFAMIPYFVPIPIMLLSVLFGMIQAIVFTLLASVYFSSATAAHH